MLNFNQKRKIKRIARNVLYFLSHPLTKEEIRSFKDDFKRIKKLFVKPKSKPTYNYLTVPDSCFKVKTESKNKGIVRF